MPMDNGAPDGREAGRPGYTGQLPVSSPGVSPDDEKFATIDTQAIADIVYRLMQRDLIYERERAPFPEDRKCRI
jgi:hypothetical protein